MDYKAVLTEQIKLLADWNKNHINGEPEQVRINAETIRGIIDTIVSGSLNTLV